MPSCSAAPRARPAPTSTRCCSSSAGGSAAPRTPTRWCTRRWSARSAAPPSGPEPRPGPLVAVGLVAVAVAVGVALTYRPPPRAGAVAVRARREPGPAAARGPGLRRPAPPGAVLRARGLVLGSDPPRGRPGPARAPRSRSAPRCCPASLRGAVPQPGRRLGLRQLRAGRRPPPAFADTVRPARRRQLAEDVHRAGGRRRRPLGRGLRPDRDGRATEPRPTDERDAAAAGRLTTPPDLWCGVPRPPEIGRPLRAPLPDRPAAGADATAAR